MLPKAHRLLKDDLLDRARGARPPQAILLTAPAGSGKERFALAFAAELMGLAPDSLGDLHQHPDLQVLRPAADSKSGSIGIDEIRAMSERLRLKPGAGGWRVALVLFGDDLTEPAANALLKTLEEPRPKSLLVILAHALGRVPATLRSRCQIVRLPQPSLDDNLALTAALLPDADAATRSALLELAGQRADEAVRLHHAGALETYRELCRTLAPLVARAQALSRKAVVDFTAKHGRADAPVLALQLFARLLERACEATASGSAPKPAIENEDRLLLALSKKLGSARLLKAWSDASGLIAGAEESHLDRRLALELSLLALDS